MSSCLPCLKVCNVPVCSEEIIIGTIADVNTDIYIVVHNKTTGRKQYVSTQSDAGGIVTLVTSGLGLMPEHSYELAVIPRPGSPCDKYTITVGEFTGTCISVTFENAKDSEGCPVTFTSVELEVETDPQPATGCVCVTQEMLDEGKVTRVAYINNLDCSTPGETVMTFETGFNLSNCILLNGRADWVSGVFTGNPALDIKAGTIVLGNMYIENPPGNPIANGIRLTSAVESSLPFDINETLRINVATPSTNPDCLANISIYGFKI